MQVENEEIANISKFIRHVLKCQSYISHKRLFAHLAIFVAETQTQTLTHTHTHTPYR